MADAKYIPAAPEIVELPGGRTRPSVELDLSNYPAVNLRNDLNARLLDSTCPFGAPAHEGQFSLDDLDLLILVTGERLGGEGAVLRRQAVVALGTLDSDRAIERLVELAISPVETNAVRIAAIAALRPGAVERLREQLDEDPSETVRDYVRWRLGGERPERRKTPGQPPEEARRGPDRCC